MALDTAYWTWLNHAFLWGSIAIYFGLSLILYEAFSSSLLSKMGSSMSQGVVIRCMQTPHFWFSILLVCIILLLPVILSRFFWFDVRPSFADRLRCKARLRARMARKASIQSPVILRSNRMRRSQKEVIRSSYAFSHSEGFGDLIVRGQLFNDMPSSRNAHLSPIREQSNGSFDERSTDRSFSSTASSMDRPLPPPPPVAFQSTASSIADRPLPPVPFRQSHSQRSAKTGSESAMSRQQVETAV